MLRQLINKIKGIDPFYEDIKTSQVDLYQHYFELVIDSINLENNTSWALGQKHDKAALQQDDETMNQIITNQAQTKGLSGCYLQIMVNQYFFADVWMREADKDQWVKRVLRRRKADYFPPGWAVFRALGLSC